MGNKLGKSWREITILEVSKLVGPTFLDLFLWACKASYSHGKGIGSLCMCKFTRTHFDWGKEAPTSNKALMIGWIVLCIAHKSYGIKWIEYIVYRQFWPYHNSKRNFFFFKIRRRIFFVHTFSLYFFPLLLVMLRYQFCLMFN